MNKISILLLDKMGKDRITLMLASLAFFDIKDVHTHGPAEGSIDIRGGANYQ